MTYRADVSVIIPFYNGGRWIARAVQSALAQKGVSLEIIIADDGSPEPFDMTMCGAHENVKSLRLPHGGKGAAINAAAKEAEGDFICVLDQDDAMLPERLRAQTAAMRAHPRASAAYSDYERRTADGKLIDIRHCTQATPDELLRAIAQNRGQLAMQTLLLRRTAFDAAGGFSPKEELTGLDDTEFFIRLACSGGEIIYVSGVYGSWTSHDGNYSKSRRFQDTRLTLIEHLRTLARTMPKVAEILPRFSFSVYYMRGLFFMEHGQPKRALPELKSAAALRPFSFNALYLLAKAFVLSLRSKQ